MTGIYSRTYTSNYLARYLTIASLLADKYDVTLEISDNQPLNFVGDAARCQMCLEDFSKLFYTYIYIDGY